jgi:putative transposase
MIVAESFLRSLIKIYGKHIVYSDDGGIWYPEACISLGLERRLNSPGIRKRNWSKGTESP